MIHLCEARMMQLLNQIRLQENVRKIPICGFVKNILRGTIPYSVHADDWPEYTTLVAKPRDEAFKSLPVHRLGIYSETPSILQNILCNEGFIQPANSIMITGMQVELIPVIENVGKKLHFDLNFVSKEDYRNIFVLSDNKDLIDTESVLPKDVYVTTLDADKHMEVIMSSWKEYNWNSYFHTDHEGIEATKYYIEKSGPSVGICRKSDDKLISWTFSDVDTSGLMGISLAECKNTKITHCRQIEFARKKFVMGDAYWGFVAQRNIGGLKTVLKFDQTKVHYDVHFVNCIMRPTKKSINIV